MIFFQNAKFVSWASTTLVWITFAIVVGWIWAPEINFWYEPPIKISRSQSMSARSLPSDEQLRELSAYSLVHTSELYSLARAEDLLSRGRLEVPGKHAVLVGTRFDPGSLQIEEYD